MSLSQWCAREGPIQGERSVPGGGPWEKVAFDQHRVCAEQRWHDEYHGKDPGCCASADEKESWACTCDCHNVCEHCG